MPQNIITTTDNHVRARMRRFLSPSFNQQSLRDQSPVIESYANKMIDCLKGICEKDEGTNKSGIVNMLDWINFFTVDIIGDLALGDSFNCLDGSDYHPWVRTLYNFFKGMVFMSAVRFFPPAESLLQLMIPEEVIQKQKGHTDFTDSKVLQRLQLKSNRPDFMTPFLKFMEEQSEKMSVGEIQSTFAIIIVAGSETTATSLRGILYNLARSISVQEKLSKHLRTAFSFEDQITVESTSDIDYLDAVINEGLWLCYAIPGGLPRVAPKGGDIYAGHFIPEDVSSLLSIEPCQGFLLTCNYRR
ncbi:MAG: RNA polymerase II mediator complex subunit [Bogoriella megaspora]|nr:MAG: RNA polymerase II mediator complex subunit [Bogoriella megaspora]